MSKLLSNLYKIHIYILYLPEKAITYINNKKSIYIIFIYITVKQIHYMFHSESKILEDILLSRFIHFDLSSTIHYMCYKL